MSDADGIVRDDCPECGHPVPDLPDECPSCGSPLIIHSSGKRFVKPCEWCETVHAANFQFVLALKATIHAYRNHPVELENYGES